LHIINGNSKMPCSGILLLSRLLSAKKDGGFGISSIISVISRYKGEYTPVWDEDTIKALVINKD